MEKTSLGWEVVPTHNFNWCHVHSIIKVVEKVSDLQPKWYVDLTDIFKELLQEMGKERQKREESQQKEENKKDLAIRLLREV